VGLCLGANRGPGGGAVSCKRDAPVGVGFWGRAWARKREGARGRGEGGGGEIDGEREREKTKRDREREREEEREIESSLEMEVMPGRANKRERVWVAQC